jgi:hypothetical protein
MSEHYTLLGVARPRAGWFTDVGRWTTSAALPADFVRCVSLDEVRARLQDGRAWSALLVDHRLDGLDRDLFDDARRAGCAVLVVDDGSRRRPWTELGATAVLDEPVARDGLLAVLRNAAQPVERLPGSGADLVSPVVSGGWQGRLVAVTGGSGTGTSTVAAALAQGLGSDPVHGGRVLLVDAALHADQAVLHDTGDVVPGLQELVEAHRSGSLDGTQVRALTWHCPDRGYDLLLGLRRHRDWTVLRARALEAAMVSLRRAYALTVADVDPDVEGEALTGSLDVEDRNLLARRLTATADVVVVTGLPTVVGLHRLVRTLDGLLDHGVSGTRLLPVVTNAPRSPRARAEVTRAVAELLGPAGEALTTSPMFLPHRRELDSLQRDGAPLPKQLARPLAQAVAALLDRDEIIEERDEDLGEPVPIVPGSLGGGAL